jgi:hypothetical protein
MTRLKNTYLASTNPSTAKKNTYIYIYVQYFIEESMNPIDSVLGNSKENYKSWYFQINHDKEEEDEE